QVPAPGRVRRRAAAHAHRQGPANRAPPAVMRALQPPGWPQPRGYANGIEASGVVFTGGRIGWGGTGALPHQEHPGHGGQALRNVAAVLAEAGATPEDVVRLTWYITDRDEYLAQTREIGAEYRAVMGRHFPAMAVVVVKELLESRAKVEIEATAVLRRD